MPEPFPFRIDFPPELPISARAGEIVDAIQANPVLVLAGETGSGKSTQIPKMCLAAGRGRTGRIACTQPRRVAALSVSRRVADELGVPWGREVGCKVRFQDQTSRATVVKFLTDGMLLAEMQADPMLREYDTIIVDEAHERSLNIDFLLGHLRTLCPRRPELRVVITSATIDTEAFSRAFEGAPIIVVEGRTFPVEVVYAPLDELGRDYAENDENAPRSDPAEVASARAEALHYVDGAVEAVVRIARESSAGDVLVFMPSERDIRETLGLVENRVPASEWDIVPLFGRLSNAEQQRVFAPSQRRKLVIATNVAETSLTIPGIRFVVDTGLARISRYAPQSRTRRLPIEPVSQSSAEQRKGRSGRVAEGVCIRLYSEADFLARPRFTMPEIQRANLADVILRMKAFGLGDIERFPFINMPATKAIRAGYALLDELGAIATEGESEAGTRSLTGIGRDLARLPVDPTVGRMILQAREEKAVREVLIIAAGLSIQDPRERPLDRQQQADTAHRRFVHPDSDFLTLLNVWDSVHGDFDTMSPSRLRRFCREHFLSFTRMREWRDIHGQLLETLEGRPDFKLTSALDGIAPDDQRAVAFGTPPFRAIHRSVLAGLLGNVARREEERPGFKATHDRAVTIFPGSALFSKTKAGPRWIMAAEIVETSRLYARTCARLDPAWVLDLASHIIRVSHSEPFWDAERGRVMVKQRSRLYGLEIDVRAVGYGKINPRDAGEIFIREGLVGDTITWPFDFLTHNRAVREGVELELSRARHGSFLNLDEAIFRFYASQLLDDPGTEPPSAVPELVDLVRERRGRDPKFLMLSPAHLRDPEDAATDAEKFPEAMPLENRALPLSYSYKPGAADDGVSIEATRTDVDRLTQAELDWAVPGHLEAKVEHYLKALPKEARRVLVPLAETARRMAGHLARRDRLTGRRETLLEALSAELRERHNLLVTPETWAARPLPEHLRIRLRVLDDKGREALATRDLSEVKAHFAREERQEDARSEDSRSRRAAGQLERELGAELGWLERDLRDLRALGTLTATLAPLDQLKADAFASIRDWITDPRRVADPNSRQSLADAAAQAKQDLRGIVPRLVDTLRDILERRQELLVLPEPYPGMSEDLERLVPASFLRDTPYLQLPHLSRYLKSVKRRAERARQSPGKDAERAGRIAPYVAALGRMTPGKPGADPEREAAVQKFRWLLEEFRVSVYSQELGTAEPVSAEKLDRMLAALSPGGAGPDKGGRPPQAPPTVFRATAKPAAPLKSLSGLDRLFPRNG